jgi:hypothetical protein
MYASSLDERTLDVGHKVIHVGSKPDSDHFSYDFCNGVDETNRSIVIDTFGSLFLWQQDNIRRIHPLEMRHMESVEMVDGPHEVVFDDAPTLFEESTGETIRLGALSEGICLIASCTSSSEKGASIPTRSTPLK